MSRPSVILQAHRVTIREIAMRHRTSNPRVFGSTLAGTDTERSDLDLLVDPLPGATLLDLGGLQVELEERLGISVDVRTPDELPPSTRASILESALPV